MTEQEAMNIIYSYNKYGCTLDIISDVKEAFDVAIKALEMQIPKKLIVRKGCNWSYKCPCCNKTLYWTDEPRNHGEKTDYCPNCGQRLDWSETE